MGALGRASNIQSWGSGITYRKPLSLQSRIDNGESLIPALGRRIKDAFLSRDGLVQEMTDEARQRDFTETAADNMQNNLKPLAVISNDPGNRPLLGSATSGATGDRFSEADYSGQPPLVGKISVDGSGRQIDTVPVIPQIPSVSAKPPLEQGTTPNTVNISPVTVAPPALAQKTRMNIVPPSDYSSAVSGQVIPPGGDKTVSVPTPALGYVTDATTGKVIAGDGTGTATGGFAIPEVSRLRNVEIQNKYEADAKAIEADRAKAQQSQDYKNLQTQLADDRRSLSYHLGSGNQYDGREQIAAAQARLGATTKALELANTQRGQEAGLEGHKYTAEQGFAGHKYTADKNLEGAKYKADDALEAARVKALASGKPEDVTKSARLGLRSMGLAETPENISTFKTHEAHLNNYASSVANFANAFEKSDAQKAIQYFNALRNPKDPLHPSVMEIFKKSKYGKGFNGFPTIDYTKLTPGKNSSMLPLEDDKS